MKLMRGSGVLVLLVIAAMIGLRAPFLGQFAFPDEAGYLIVARNWHDDGSTLYGSLFVDRPPLLLIFYRIASFFGGIPAARLMGLLVAAVLVAASAWVGQLLAGHRGTACAALTSAALIANPLLGTSAINAELLGAPLTMLACGCFLSAVRREPPGWRAPALLVITGALGAGALLVKQNLFDALVFGVVFCLTAAMTKRWAWSKALRFLLLGLVGAAIPVGLTIWWAITQGPGAGSLWFTLYQFRIEAAGVVASQPSPANKARIITLAILAVTSGLVFILLVSGRRLIPSLRHRSPIAVAAIAMVLWEIVGIAGGGSYWSHYLVGLIPGAVLLASATANREWQGRRLGVAALTFALTSTVVTVGISGSAQTVVRDHRADLLSQWLDAASKPGDSGTVLYGNANILLGAGLRPGSEQLWSLPTRTLDPRLWQLNASLNRPDAPTWVIGWHPIDSWGLDSEHRVLATLSLSYRRVATVCDVPLYLHRGVHRYLPATPVSC